MQVTLGDGPREGRAWYRGAQQTYARKQSCECQKQQLGPGWWWLSGLTTGLQTERLLVQFPVKAHAWIAGWVPSWGVGETTYSHTLMFLSLSFFLPSSLSENK